MSEIALVTGSSGFVGRYLCRELRRHLIKSVALARPHSMSNDADARIDVQDVFDIASLRRAIAKVNPQFVFHLAGSAVEPNLDGIYRANALFGASVFAALELLDTPPVVIVAGSAAEYGPIASEHRAITEDTPCRPVLPYGIAKLAQTHHALAMHRCRPVVARLFNPIGSGMPKHLALGKFAAHIATVGPQGGILETGLLDVERDFFDVADGARCLFDLAKTPEAVGQIVNICSGAPTSVRTLTEQLIAVSGKNIRIVEDDGRGSSTRSLKVVVGSTARLEALGIAPPRLATERMMQSMLH
jgi:nucleoside-diphosphate-sugar epimerase